MKQIIGLLLGTLLLAGCQSSPSSLGPDTAAEAAIPACANVAAERARDAANNWYDEALQQAIYNEAYKTCAASKSEYIWIGDSTRHGS